MSRMIDFTEEEMMYLSYNEEGEAEIHGLCPPEIRDSILKKLSEFYAPEPKENGFFIRPM